MQASPVPVLSFSTVVSTPRIPIQTTPKKTKNATARNLFLVKTLDKSHVTSSSSRAPSATPLRQSPRRAAVAEVKASADPLAALSRLEDVLQVQDLNILLFHFGELRRWSEVSQVFDWMQRRERLNCASYSSFIKSMGLSRNHVKALQVYDSIADEGTRVNASVCNSTLGCLVRNGRFESSMKLFHQMKDEGLLPDLVTYSTLLSGCRTAKNGYSVAMDLVHELRHKGLQMDSVIYGTLIAICASNGLCKEAEDYFQQMLDEGGSPNVFHYSSLLNAYSVDGDYMKAEKLMNDMKSLGIEPNKVILTTLLKVYSRGGLFEKARDLLAQIDALGYAEDEISYCLLMDNLAKSGHVREAKAIFSEMRGKGVKSDGYAYSIMISALCRSGSLNEAKQLAKDFESSYEKYDLVMANTLLRAYCNAGDMESMMQMMKKMDELTISPDWNTFHILIKYFCKENLYHLAYRTIEDMYNKGHQLDEELCTSLILQLGQVGSPSEAFSVYNLLKYSKRNLCKTLHEKVLGILVAAGLLKDAYVIMKDNMELISPHTLKKFAISFMKSGNINLINDVLKALHRSGCRIDQEVFRVAVSRYIENPEKKELLLQLLQWMSGQGYVVDSSSRNLLLKNSHLLGQKQFIAEILSRQYMMSKKVESREVKR